LERILTANWDVPGSHTLAVYQKRGGYAALKKALGMTGEAIVDEVKKASLRGRGGAGFPAGVKWGFLPKDSNAPKYLVINADEGEPGTFKDREIMWQDPHMMIEGCIICAIALGIETCYIYIRGEFRWIGERIEAAIQECYQAGYLGKNVQGKNHNLEMYCHYGAGAYICGEETGLLESLEGKPGQPRNKPPFPAIVGLFGCPTIINNVETAACIPSIINRGGEWFLEQGCERNGGSRLYGVCGHVKTPGVFEAPCGIPLRDVIYKYGGGLLEGHTLKGIIPGGASCPILLPDEIDVAMSVEAMAAAGTMLGTSGVIVMDDRTCMVRYAARTAHFYHHESCGQCTPCREGTGWAARVLDEIEAGHGKIEDLNLLLEICDQVEGNTICALGDALALPIRSLINKFHQEFVDHIEGGGCPFPEW
jgi:NADH-quinone oxidoreductase subunit F